MSATAAFRELLERHGVRIVGGKARCISPDHDDKKPSMSIDIDQGVFHCHGCHAKGGVVKAFMLLDGLSKKQAGARALGGHDESRRPALQRKASQAADKTPQITDDVKRRIDRAGAIWTAAVVAELPRWFTQKFDPDGVMLDADYTRLGFDNTLRVTDATTTGERIGSVGGDYVVAMLSVLSGIGFAVQCIAKDKKLTHGPMCHPEEGQGAVVLGDLRKAVEIGVVEGVADACAVRITRMNRENQAVLAAVGTSGMVNGGLATMLGWLDQDYPRHVTIFADGDEPGRDAAGTLALALRITHKITVRLLHCPDNKDPADVYAVRPI